jgi:hypothetical protein
MNLVKQLLNDRESRMGSMTLVLFGYTFGYLSQDNPRNDIIYDSNFFDLLYNYLTDCNSGKQSKNTIMMERIEEYIKKLPNNEQPINTIEMIMDIAKNKMKHIDNK